MTDGAVITEDDRKRMRNILEQHRSFGDQEGGLWDSLDDAPNEAVDAVVEQITELVEDSPNGTKFLKAAMIEAGISESEAGRLPNTTWIGRVCTLLAEEDHEYEVVLEASTENTGKNGRCWRATSAQLNKKDDSRS